MSVSCEFPGFRLHKRMETKTHNVESGTIVAGGATYGVKMVRSKKLPSHVNGFVPAEIARKGEGLVWSYGEVNLGGPAHLVQIAEQPVLVLTDRTKRYVNASVWFSDLPIQIVEGTGKNGMLGARAAVSFTQDVEVAVRLKTLSAELLDLKPRFDQVEKPIAKRLWREMRRAAEEAKEQAEIERRIAKREAEAEAEREKKEAATVKRRQRQEQIRSRRQIDAWTRNGTHRRGVPVTEEEWRSLPDGAWAVLVDSFDEETQAPGKPLESFRVKKSAGGKVGKANEVALDPSRIDPPSTHSASSEASSGGQADRHLGQVPTAKAVKTVSVNGKNLRLLVYSAMEDIRQVRVAGQLNGGALVTAEDQKHGDGRFQVYALKKGKIETAGVFEVR